jgi:serine/threonine protein kinase
MNWLSDEAIARLQTASALPDLAGTRYRLIERVGGGGMGTVYLAEDSVLGRRVALKILDLPELRADLSARLLREAQILGRLEHPGIVPVHDAGTLADGRIFQRICEAVAFAHACGILHRDLKPENIMVGPFGEVLVMDWGVAKILSEDRTLREEHAEVRLESSQNAATEMKAFKTAHGTVLGTAGYMAPEQARGEIDGLDERADIYSLGAILRFLLSGKQLAPGEDLSSRLNAESAPLAAAGSAPKAVAAISQKAMAEDRASRYASVSDLANDIARYLDGSPVSAYPENVFQRAGRWATRYRVAIGLVLAYLIVRALLLLWLRR